MTGRFEQDCSKILVISCVASMNDVPHCPNNEQVWLCGFFYAINVFFFKSSRDFNESLATSVVPTSFKKSVIIPVPKNSKPSCLNDYRPVALTSTVMKVFERLLKKHPSLLLWTLFSLPIGQIGLLMMLDVAPSPSLWRGWVASSTSV